MGERAGVDGSAIFRELERGYGENDLAYHNLVHIEDCCRQLDGCRDLAEDVVAVELAIFFHDLIYDPRRSDNEELSSECAKGFLAGTGFADQVAGLILATKHTTQASDHDARLICDIDLSILGRSEDVYARYAGAIREEYAWVPEADYRAGRRAVLENFLGRESIFSHDVFVEKYEAAARRNLADEIRRL
jgi:predicted metal-dependent HD superfamily phosphohydrolase